ncbi:MAG: hypothetical protein ACYS47_07360 [Planctomycetota bacterium]|jgi:hypothetical protein
MKRILLVSATLALLLPALAFGQESRDKNLQQRYNQMAATLRNKVLSVDFKDAAFTDVVQFFRVATGINIVVDRAIYDEVPEEDCTVNLNVNDLPAGEILDLILRFKKISRVFRHGVLLITTQERGAGKPFMRIYDVRDLNVPLKDFPGVDIELKGGDDGSMTPIFEGEEADPKHYSTDEIVELIRENTGVDSWDSDGCRISIFRGVLIVVQTVKVHKEIVKLLAHLRSTR